jgi:SHO1 osmosensor
MAMTPMRNSEGYDFTPILTHYVFLLTSVLAIVSMSFVFTALANTTVLPQAGWFVAFIGQIVTQARCNSITYLPVVLLNVAPFSRKRRT